MVQLLQLGKLINSAGRGGFGGGGPSGGPFPVNAVNFDGTNDWMNRGDPLTGAVDGDSFLLSMWFNFLGADDALVRLVADSTTRIQFSRHSGNGLDFWLRNAAPAVIWRWTSDGLFSSASNPGWHHILIAAELDGTPVGQVYVDDAALAITEQTAPTEGDIDWTVADTYIGANSGSNKFNGDFAEVYLTNEYLDISQVANRRKFIDASGYPVDMGSGGITPTGTAALIFQSGATDAWHTNKGSGGGFTETGALTNAATSPSD